MMSISPLKSASKAADYYLKEEQNLNQTTLSLEKDGQDNYYLKEQGATQSSFWHGKLAEEAGLAGKPVEQATLERVLSGQLGEETIKGKRNNHKCGLDLTFSAPKSYSILALVGGHTDLIALKNEAIKSTLDQIQKDVAQVVSINDDGERELTNTESMIFAAIPHRTSRENDPQLHDHVLTPNMTRDQEGALRTLASTIKQQGGVINGSSERIYNFQKYYTALYQSTLAKGCEALGYKTQGIGNGQFDIEGVPQTLTEAFSSRKQQIDQQALEFGDTQAARDTAALDTRKSKQYESDEALNAKWTDTVVKAGFKPENLVSNALNAAKDFTPAPKQFAIDAFERAVEHLGQTSTAFKLEKIIELAASDFTKGGQQANALDLKVIADDWIKSGTLIPLTEKGQYTTQAMLNNEQRLMAVTQGRTHHMRTPVNDSTLSRLNIGATNRQNVADIYESTKQFHVVNVSGSHEQIAQNLLNVGNHAGKRVHLVSQNAKDKHHHTNSIVRESHSVAAWIKHTFTQEQRHSVYGLLNADVPLTNKDVLLIDSAHKMSANELLSLSEKAKQSGSKVILLNPTSSRQGMKGHNAIDLFAKGNVTTHEWVNSKAVQSSIAMHDSTHHSLAQTYAAMTNKDDVQVLATSSLEQRRLTQDIRATLQNNGQLARVGTTLTTLTPHYLSKPQQALAQHYKKGMVLRRFEEGKAQDWLVTQVDKSDNILHLMNTKNSKTEALDPSSRAFKTHNHHVFKPESLDVAVGERLMSTGHHKISGLSAHERYVVTGYNKDTLTLTKSDGQSLTVATRDLKGAPLRYDYVSPISHIESRSHTLLSGKAFSLSKELLHDVSEKSPCIDVFTDQPDKAKNSLDKSDTTFSAIERVMHTQTTNDRYLTEATQETLRSDITEVLKHLTQAHNQPLHDKAVNFALNHLSEKEAAFTQKELVIAAIRYAFEEAQQPIIKEEIEAVLAKRADTLSVEYSDGTRWTTQAALDTEKHILRNIDQGKNQHTPYATARQVKGFLGANPMLTQGQKDAITLISTTKDTFVAVQGLAGTGKSTMLGSNIELIHQTTAASKQKPDNVIGLAPTHAAVSELEKKGVKAQTLESLLTDVRRGVKTAEDYNNSLFFLDESSMASNRQTKEITDLVLASGSKTVLLGDKEQLLSQSAGKPFEMMINQGRIDTAYMTDMIRQQTRPLKGAAHNIIDAQPLSALDKLKSQEPDKQGNHQHVVSTLDENAKDKQKAQLMATEMLPYMVAKDYLERTPETRDNTLVIAYTNTERDIITEYIRDGLIEKKELGKENIITTRLRSTGDSKEELSTMLPYQKGLILSTRPGHYSTIESVNSELGVVMLKDAETGKETVFLPRNKDHKFTTLFAKSEKPLSSGDKIMTRFTDKARGIKANVEYRVQEASTDGIIARASDGQTLTLQPNSLKDGHWDYAYTRTADMAQGSTYANVITAIRSKANLTNLRRAGIDLTRPKLHARLYTDNLKRMVNTWLSNQDLKTSAIETLAETLPEKTVYFNDAPLAKEDVRFQNKAGDFDYQRFREHIIQTLPRFTESLATRILGKPNASKSDRDYLTFGTGQSAIKVTLTGEYRGYFKDYTTGEKGSLINLMMSHEGITYKEAMNQANNMINEPEKYEIKENPKHEILIKTTPKHIAKFENRARDYMASSQPISGTLAERYLNSLGVDNPNSQNIRYHDAVYSSEDKQFHPAILTNIHNKEGETKAIEVTYLNKEGNKSDTLDINPRTLGTKSKNMTQFHHGTDLNTTIISTSIENSFIINQSMKGEYDIINVNHKNDIQNISRDELRQTVIIVLSQGNTDLNPNNIDKIMENFSGRDIHFVSHQDTINEIKTCLNKESIPSYQDNKELDIKDFNKHIASEKHDNIINQHHKEKDSKALDHFEPTQSSYQKSPDKDIHPQQQLDLEISR